MTQEEKQLLLKDLCGRLAYGGVKVKYTPVKNDITYTIIGYLPAISDSENVLYVKETDGLIPVSDVMPYLRPMSSMTDEERMFFHQNSATVPVLVDAYRVTYKKFYAYRASLIDWLIINHFDWRGLIELGLALEAPEGMYA